MLIYLLLLFSLHIFKSVLLYQYNKKLNKTINCSDLLGYMTSAYFFLNLEDGKKSLDRSVILVLHKFILFMFFGALVYALWLIYN